MNEFIESMYHDGMSASNIYRSLKKHVSHSDVFKAVKHFRKTGTCIPRIRKTPKKSVRRKRLIKCTRKKLRRNPARSIRKLTAEVHVSPSTMHRLLKKDLKVKAYKITKRQLLSDTKKERLERAKLILQKLIDDMQTQVHM